MFTLRNILYAFLTDLEMLIGHHVYADLGKFHDSMQQRTAGNLIFVFAEVIFGESQNHDGCDWMEVLYL